MSKSKDSRTSLCRARTTGPRNSFSLAAIAAVVLLAGCGRYSDFTLPAPSGNPAHVIFEWSSRPTPVLARGAAGSFDAVDTLNPSVVRHGSVYFNLYSGFDGKTWHTGLATSPDGSAWTRRGRVLSPDPAAWEGGYIAANGSVLFDRGEFLYWYQAGDPTRIGLARSEDALHWRKLPHPVLGAGPRGSWDERGVADPYVIRTADYFYLFYLGTDRARRQRLGVARSADGVRWTKLRSNPILELGTPGAFDENGLGEPAVWAAHGSYWMLYTGRDRQEVRRMGLAQSPDGANWRRVMNFPPISGAEPWDSKVVCDPTAELDGDTLRVWFGGGDTARPDERLNGQIGYGTLHMTVAP
ncbi:MAG: hypothetical protein ABI165_18225 [Bryobacteraceae bacterium]